MRVATQKALPLTLLGVIPVLVLVSFVAFEWVDHQIAPDFHYGLYRQAKDFVASGVPFDPVHVAISGENRVYTLVATMLATPLTLLPVGVADLVITGLLVAAAGATLAVLGVRDWRVYGVIALWPAVLSGVQTGNLSLFLGLIAALAWRFRERRIVAGLLVGLAGSLEVYMWPLGIWLVATRRFTSAAVALGVSLCSLLIMLPFGDPIDYFRLAERNAAAMGKHAYSLYVLLGGGTEARIAWIALAGAALLAALKSTDRSSFTFAILCTILFSPIVWLHFFAILVVPLAIARPRFGPLWLLPTAFWLVPFGTAAPWQIVLVLCVTLGLVIRLGVPDGAIAALRMRPRRLHVAPQPDAVA